MTKGKVMDLSKCGGVCRGACKHYAIGVECPPEATYEPVEVAVQPMVKPLTMAGIKEALQEDAYLDDIMAEWLIAEVERLTAENENRRQALEWCYDNNIRVRNSDVSFDGRTIKELAKAVRP